MKGVIIQRNAGKVVPRNFLELAVAEHHDAIGTAIADTRGDGAGELLTAVGYMKDLNLAPDQLLEKVVTMLEADPDKDMTLFLGSSSTYNDDDLQPHVLLSNEQKDPLVAVFLVGDFNNFAQTDSAHPPEFFAATTFLRPMIKKLFGQLGNDLDKLFSELSDPLTQQNIRNAFGAKGTAVFLSANGAIVGITQGANHKEFPWGETSEHFGYTEETQKSTKNRLADMLGIKGKNKATGEPKKTEAEPAKPHPEVPAEEPAKQPTPAEVEPPKGSPQVKFVLKAAPSNLKGKNAIKNWYRDNSIDGTVPENWKGKPKVKCKVPEEPIRTLQEIPQTETVVPQEAGKPKEQQQPEPQKAGGGLAAMLGIKGKKNKAISQLAQEQEKKETSAPQPEVPAAQPESEPKAIPDGLITPQELKALREGFMKSDVVLKHVDKSSNDVPDPKFVHEFEQKLPTFAEVAGLPGLESTFFWDPEAYAKLIDECPTAALVLMMNYRSALFRAEMKSEAPKNPEPKKGGALERLMNHSKKVA